MFKQDHCWMFYRWKTTISCCTAQILKFESFGLAPDTSMADTNVAEKFGFRPKCWPNLFSKAQGVVPKTFQVKEVGKKRGIHRHCQVFDRWRLHGNLEWLSTSLSLKPKDKTKVKWNKGNTQIRTYSYNQEGFGHRLGRFIGYLAEILPQQDSSSKCWTGAQELLSRIFNLARISIVVYDWLKENSNCS